METSEKQRASLALWRQLPAIFHSDSWRRCLPILRWSTSVHRQELIGETMVWVLPSTSGRARPHWLRLQHHWRDLGEWYLETRDRVH